MNQRHILVCGSTGNLGKAIINHAQTLGDQGVDEWQPTWQITAWSKHGHNNTTAVSLERWYASGYALKHCQPFDMVVMAHGIQQPATVKEYTPELWQRMLENNLTSCVALTHNLIALNKLRPNALLVYISSIQAQTPRKGRGMYAMAKAAVEALTKTMAMELAPDARTVCLRLGQLQHTMGGVIFDKTEREALEQRTLLPWVDEKDVAKLCFSLYEQNSITGSIIDLSSGQVYNVW